MLTIGQLAKRTNLRTSTLRYYEDEGLLIPTKRSESGYRLYDETAEQTLQFILRAQRLGFSLADIRQLLAQLNTGEPETDGLVQLAEKRYLAIEKQMTQWLILRHEMSLFLQDLHQHQALHSHQHPHDSVDTLFTQLIERVCVNTQTNSTQTMLDWLLKNTDCQLTTEEGQRLLEKLRGQHIHVWQENEAYHILVVSHEQEIGNTLISLAQLETGCHAHNSYTQKTTIPKVTKNHEGYLLICSGENAFLLARLLLSIAI